MDTMDAIRSLRAVRSFRDTPVPEEIVRQILEAGRLTGNSMNAQPWHFVVVRDKEMLRRLGSVAPTGPYVAQAPVAIVVGTTPSRFGDSDASRAIQSMMLAAWAHGVGSNWVGFHNLDGVKSLLGIPDDVSVLAIVPFGYPTKSMGAKKRKALGEIAHRERFGQPYS